MKHKMKRGEINYIVDIIIGIAFLLSIFSGILLLFLPSGSGFHRGRNAYFVTSIMGMDRWFIKDMHSISSIIMSLGVLGHIILHWNWFLCMTRNILKRNKNIQNVRCEVNM